MEIPQDSRHRVGFLDFLDVLDSLVFLDFLDFYIHNVLIENIHVKHSIFVSARIYIYIYIYDTPTQAEFGTKIRGHRSSPKIHQKYRKYQQNQLKHRFFLLGGTIYIYICLNDFKYKYYICMDLCGRIAYKQPNTAIYAS